QLCRSARSTNSRRGLNRADQSRSKSNGRPSHEPPADLFCIRRLRPDRARRRRSTFPEPEFGQTTRQWRRREGELRFASARYFDFMTTAPNHNSGATEAIQHLYVHIPFCARICPYCAFYKDLLDRSETPRFCEAILCDLDQQCAAFALMPRSIYFGGGTPTALSTPQLEFLLVGFRQRLDLSALEDWTI